MNTLMLFRLGRHLIAGESLNLGKGPILQIRATHRVDEQGRWYSVQQDVLEVRECYVVNEKIEAPSSITEAEAVSVLDLLHESLMPLVSSMREVSLGESRLVAYERRHNPKGLGFLEGQRVSWIPLESALVHPTLGQRLALEARKPRLEAVGLWNRASPEGVMEQLTVLGKDLHVYMKLSPWRDISELHEGTSVQVNGYHKGCAVIDADGEEFWLPIEEAAYFPTTKDDWYYFNLDADMDAMPDPLEMLPSKIGINGMVGTADWEDNFNAQPDLPSGAGNFYGAVAWLKNQDFAIFRQGVPIDAPGAAVAILQGAPVDKVLGEMIG